MKRLSTILALALTASLPAIASAESPVSTVESPRAQPSNSINVSPLGLLVGSYSLNYERMLSGGHGLMVEANYANSSDSESSATSGGASVGYRWHWRGKQNSGFLGVNAGYQTGTGEATVTTNGNSKMFDVDTKVFFVTANIGKRWALDNGINITFRVGAGYGSYEVTTESTDPDAESAVDLVDALLTIFPVAVDGELSLGYTF